MLALLLMLPGPALADTAGLAAYLRARVADERGQSDRAAADYSRALAASQDPAIAIRAYREALVTGDLALAVRALTILERAGVAPDDAALLPIAQSLRARDWPAAETHVATLDGKRLSILTPVIRAWIAQARGQDSFTPLDAAADPIARRLATEARVLLLIATGREAEGITLLRSLGGATAGIDLRVAAAQALGSRGKPELARGLFAGDPTIEAALARTPVDPDPAFGVSRLFARLASDLLGDEPNPLAITLARAALVAEPGNERARLLLGNALARTGATDHALAALAEVAPAGPFAPAAAAARVAVLTAANRRPEALADARRLAVRAEAGRNDWQTVADLLVDSGFHAEAVPFYRRIADGEGAREWVVWMQYGGALEEAGRWSEARTALAKAVELAPDEPIALNYFGYSRLTRGESPRDPTRLLERAHRLAPDSASIADSLGWAYHLTGDTPRALPLLERAAQAEPANAEIAEHLGDAYWKLGRRFEARYSWSAAALVADAKDAGRLRTKATDGLRSAR